MDYRKPKLKDEEILRDYVKEHHDRGEKSITASFGLSSMAYADWVRMIHENEEIGNEFGRSLLFLCFEKEKLIGLLSVRYDMPKELADKYGHIGYGVRPSKRRKGYASRMLAYGLSVCREYGLKEVILGCYKSNAASAATIEKNGGVKYLECDAYKPGVLSCYYKIIL